MLVPLLLAACASNPLVNQPDRTPEGTVPTMGMALARAQQLKAAYHDKAHEFVGRQVALNDALLGLGVLTIGLGVSTAHPDTYKTTAFGAGAAYLFGLQNSRSRLEVYQSGIGAVNCAVLASSPLQVGDAELNAIAAETRLVTSTLPGLNEAIAAAVLEFGQSGGALNAATQQRVVDQIDSAQKTRDAALAAIADAGALPPQMSAVAKQLKATLEVIDVQVNKALGSTVSESTAVLQSLKSLVALTDQFAPGLQLAKGFDAALAARNVAQADADDTPGAVKTAVLSPTLRTAMLQLARRQAEVQSAAVPLAERLRPYKGHTEASALALKECNVSNVSTAIRVDREELRFTANAADAQSAIVTLSGGVKPYSARLRESPAPGIEVRSPIAGDSTVEVRVAKSTAPITATLMVTDNSSPFQSKELKVIVEPSPGKAGAQSDTAATSGSGVAADLAPFAAALDKLIQATSATFKVKSHTYTLQKTEGRGDDVLVHLTCKAAATDKNKDSLVDVRRAIAKKSGKDPGLAQHQRIVPKGDLAACMA